MRILLALICFIAMMLHAFFGYFLYIKGENIFYPEQKQISIIEKAASMRSPATELVIPSTEEANAVSDKSVPPAPPAPSINLTKSTSTLSTNDALEVSPDFQAPTPKMLHPEFSTGWAGFLQVENALLAFILFILGFSVCVVKGRGAASRWVFGFNLVFWGGLTLAVWFFHPINTPLNILRLTFNFPEWYFILGAAGLAALLSFLLFVNAFRGPVVPKVKNKSAAEPVLKNKESEVKKAEVKTAEPAVNIREDNLENKPSRFSLFSKDKKEEKMEEKKDVKSPFETKKSEDKSAPAVDSFKVNKPTDYKPENKVETSPFKKEEPKLNPEKKVENKSNVFEKPLEKPVNNLEQKKADSVNKTDKKDGEASTIIVPPAPKKNK